MRTGIITGYGLPYGQSDIPIIYIGYFMDHLHNDSSDELGVYLAEFRIITLQVIALDGVMKAI